MEATKEYTRRDWATELLARRKSKDSFKDFVLYTTPGYIIGPAHELMFSKLQAVADGKIKRLMLFFPPQNGKSTLVSKRFPAWMTGRFPDKFSVVASYEQDLATVFGRELRNLVGSKLFSNVFGNVVLAEDSDAASRWNTMQGGGFYAVGVGSGLTGRGMDLGIIDDPLKDRKAAESKTIREACKQWYRSTFLTRQHKDTPIIICMTRWHSDDLAGWLMKEQGDEWEVINVQAIHEDGVDPVGRQKGEPLWPEKYPLAWLEKQRRDIGEREFQSLYQGKPSSTEGHILKREHWRYWTPATLPAVFDDMIIYVDANVEEGDDNDETALECWGKHGSNYYLIDLASGVLGMSGQLDLCRAFITKHPAAVRRLVEDKANGPAIVNMLRDAIPGLIAVPPASPRGNNKVQRAIAVEPFLAAGNVFIPEPGPAHPWVEKFIEQCAQFPNGDHDDLVDAFTGPINWWQMNNDYSIGFGGGQ